MSIDVNQYSLYQWVRFIFEHPVSTPEWYFVDHLKWEGDPQYVMKHAAQLFGNPLFY